LFFGWLDSRGNFDYYIKVVYKRQIKKQWVARIAEMINILGVNTTRIVVNQENQFEILEMMSMEIYLPAKKERRSLI
jgi:phosphoribosylaminoimidazole carboxylase (NCAIR synthetase)